MADNCYMKCSVFIRKTSSNLRISERMGNFKIDCCRPWAHNPFKAFKNRKRSAYVGRQQVRSINRNLFFFKLKLLIFRQWRQTWMKWTTINWEKTAVLFRSFVLLPNSMSKFIHNRCKCKLKDVRAKIFQSIEFFWNFYCRQIMSYLCQQCKKIWGSPSSFQR